MRATTMILLGLLLAACSSGGYRQPAAAPSTFTATGQPSSPRDAGEQLLDLAPRTDLQGALPDLASSPPDLRSQPDLAAPPPDMATVSDLATAPADMTPPPGCFVKLAPATALPQRFTEGTWRWELGEIPRPDLAVDFLIDFEAYKLFDRYIITVDDPSCPRCPTWRADRWGPGRYSYHGPSTAGWKKPVLTVEVSSGGELDFRAFQLTAPCR